MSSLKKLLVEEGVLRKKIIRYIENGRKQPISKRTIGFYEQRLAQLRSHWDDYSALDLSIALALSEDASGKETEVTYIKEDRYVQTETSYMDHISELAEGLRLVKADILPAGSSDAHESSITTVVHHDSPLPKISLPKFNGDYDMWRSFSDLFVALVHNNSRLSSVQKLHHLKSCLTGEAERVLRHTPITDSDYIPAWNKLKKRFENVRILVNHQLKLLVNQPSLYAESSKGIKSLVDTTEECLQQLKGLKVDTSHWDALLIYVLVQKLPVHTLKLWEEEQGADDNLPTLDDFKTFLNNRLKVLESIADVLGNRTTPHQTRTLPREKTTSYHSTKEGGCPACGKGHFLLRCHKFKGMSTDAKKGVILAAGLCLNCLSKTHIKSECTSKHKCFKCGQPHHTSLHPSNSKDHAKTQQSVERTQVQDLGNGQAKSNPEGGLNVTQAFMSRRNLLALLSTALVVAQGKHGHKVLLRCVIDPGSQSSFVTEEACQRLATTCSPTSFTVYGISPIPTTSSKETILQLQSSQLTGPTVTETFLVLKEITDLLPRQRIVKGNFKHLDGLKLADPSYWKPGPIDALLGVNVYAQIIQKGIRRGTKTAPVALKTLFGWIILGPTTDRVHKEAVSFMATTENELNDQLRQFFETEEFPSHPIFKAEELECQDIFQTSHARMDNGQYSVKLPFVNNKIPKLGESRPQALTRFMALQGQLSKKPDLAKDYTKCLDEYIQLGHMEEAPPLSHNQPHYYIPHHAVYKDSTTTRLRVVFDASCKTTNGTSLNDHLLKGPTLQPKLFAILMNWRKYRVALTADVEKMYRMILVHPEQRSFQRIIWKHPTTGKVQDFQLNTVTFGTSAAPYLAIRTLQQLAEDERQNWPLASKIAFKDFYVDDLLTGADDTASAKVLQHQMIEMMKTGGFNLRKWASNEPDLLTHLPPEYCELREALAIGEMESVKTLGIQWFPTKDYFTFKLSLKPGKPIPTKRSVLSEIASLYDPLGWLAPVIIVAKMLMQAMWITGCTWDAPLSTNINQQWNNFKKDLEHLPRIRIPRWIRYTTTASVQLHGFCDASTRAYAAVLYQRTVQEDGSITSMLLTAKTRVAPIKPTTIPRLELNGALILARLIQTTTKDMNLENTPVFAWTDSTITLQWIREHPSRWKTYVANRVVEIQDSLRYDAWRHVPTADNPADLASRGTTVNELCSNNLWWHGPTWLSKSEDHWPRLGKCEDITDLEARKPSIATFVAEIQDDLLVRYSSFSKLIRIIALILRFKENCKKNGKRQFGLLSTKELCNAETVILLLVQKTSFPNEYHNLSHNKPVSHSSNLCQLSPFIDEQGLIRIQGRLSHATIVCNRKHQIILPKKHQITSLIIDKLHQETLHGGTTLVLASSRHKFWIIDARRAISTRIRNCVVCTRFRKQTCHQMMGDLPEARVNITKTFNKVGLDYAGPVMIKASHLRKAPVLKAYLCIFVCMATKAMHIELVSDLTTETFLAALKRFVARRGLPADIYSDCGSNFVGAKAKLDKDLKKAILVSNQEAAKYFSNQAINWHFIPPAAPHFGGLWEAGVRSVKTHLRRSLGNLTCTFEEYATLLTQVEAVLNSRPLCYVSTDPNHPEILTPGHFLIGQALNTPPDPDGNNNTTITQRWKMLQQRLTQFWKNWSRDYLHQLQTRNKWHQRQKNLQVGDVVLVTHENMPPARWPLGVVEEVYPGQDGLMDSEYDEDVLILSEQIFFSMHHEADPNFYADSDGDINPRSSRPSRSSATAPAKADINPPQSSGAGSTSRVHPARLLANVTTHTKSTPSQPALINGASESSLAILRPTTTINELKMRINNSHQRFVTREGVDIYLTRDVLQRTDFEAIAKTKKREKTLNLPERYQVRVKVKPHGRLSFFHYHKRGVVRKLLNQRVQREGEC